MFGKGLAFFLCHITSILEGSYTLELLRCEEFGAHVVGKNITSFAQGANPVSEAIAMKAPFAFCLKATVLSEIEAHLCPAT
jgi:hypothetical protein